MVGNYLREGIICGNTAYGKKMVQNCILFIYRISAIVSSLE